MVSPSVDFKTRDQFGSIFTSSSEDFARESCVKVFGNPFMEDSGILGTSKSAKYLLDCLPKIHITTYIWLQQVKKTKKATMLTTAAAAAAIAITSGRCGDRR